MAPAGRHLCLLLLLFLPVAPSLGRAEDARGGASLQVESWEDGDLLGAEISSRLDHPYTQVQEALSNVESWCEFIPLVFNIKACTFDQQADQTFLNLYVGRKFHHSASQAYRLRYRFQVQNQSESPSTTRIQLFAREGPHGTADYLIELQARPTGDGHTALSFQSSFRSSWRSRIGTRTYLAGAGQNKVGFSIEGYKNGKPAYVRGVKGIVERNAMRYYLALQAYLDTLHLPEEERLEARLHAWFEATEKYPEQLHEMDRQRYLEVKRREMENQEERQRLLGGKD